MPRRILIPLIAAAALILVSVLLVLTVNRSPQLQNQVRRIVNRTSNRNANANQTVNTNTTPSTDENRTTIAYVARNFAERYGSGTNQNDFRNVIEAETWGTKDFIDYLNRQIAQSRLSQPTTPYHGFITKALSVKISSLKTTSASVTVTTQRQETIGPTTKTYYQDLGLDFLKDGSTWKINAAAWKPI